MSVAITVTERDDPLSEASHSAGWAPDRAALNADPILDPNSLVQVETGREKTARKCSASY
jgi:hypothetical protein